MNLMSSFLERSIGTRPPEGRSSLTDTVPLITVQGRYKYLLKNQTLIHVLACMHPNSSTNLHQRQQTRPL